VGQTKISWTDVTINPFPGCLKVSPGCANCYAERMAMRLKAMGQSQYQDVVDEHGWTGRSSCVGVDVMRVVGKGKKVFVNSMGDLFFEGNPFVGIDTMVGAMLDQPQHTFQILTKRAERVLAYYEGVAKSQGECGEPNPLAYAPNIWLGVTAENQEWADKRIPILLDIPAAVRFVSLEPLLGSINFTVKCPPHFHPILRLDQIGWVIVGAESGLGRRPCDIRWVADIVKQCWEAGIPVFVKQVQHALTGELIHDVDRIADYLGYAPEEIRQFPKKPRGE